MNLRVAMETVLRVSFCFFFDAHLWCQVSRTLLQYVTSYAKTFRTVSRFKTDSRSPAVQADRHTIRTPRATRSKKIHHPFERFGLSVQENSSAVRTAQAICSKKIISRSNSSSYPFEKFISRSNGSSYPFEKFTAVPTRQDSPCFVK